LFGLPGYGGNPFRAHREVHEQQPFTPAHFARWLDLFEETMDLGWAGPNASRAKELARTVARVHSTQLIGESVVSGLQEGTRA
jgi:hemoglobin